MIKSRASGSAFLLNNYVLVNFFVMDYNIPVTRNRVTRSYGSVAQQDRALAS